MTHSVKLLALVGGKNTAYLYRREAPNTSQQMAKFRCIARPNWSRPFIAKLIAPKILESQKINLLKFRTLEEKKHKYFYFSFLTLIPLSRWNFNSKVFSKQAKLFGAVQIKCLPTFVKSMKMFVFTPFKAVNIYIVISFNTSE